MNGETAARTATIRRKTAETEIELTLALDDGGVLDGATGIGFFDHMLALFAKHGRFSLGLKCAGDLHVDGHHTVEDVGICLGQALVAALGEKRGIARYGAAHVPMDECLARAVVDLSGRPYCVVRADVTAQRIGEFDVELAWEFFRAFAMAGRFSLHVDLLRGGNAHHAVESCFKAVARALREACAVDPTVGDDVPSTKGSLA